MSTETLTRPDDTTTDDDDLVAHIVRDPDALTNAMIEGTEVTALCGKTWVPHRDPKGLPMCERCVWIAQERFGVDARSLR